MYRYILKNRVMGSHLTLTTSISSIDQTFINLLNVPFVPKASHLYFNMDQKLLPTLINGEEDDEQTHTATTEKQDTLTEKDNDTVTVFISWNNMTVRDWVLCAKDAGDLNWRVTRSIALKNMPEGFNMIYRGEKLVQVQYCQPYKDNDEGYKGRGMSYREKDEIEEHFIEIYDPYQPYVYVRQTALDLLNSHTPVTVNDTHINLVRGKSTGWTYTMQSRYPTFGDETGLNDNQTKASKRKQNNPVSLQNKKTARFADAVAPKIIHEDDTDEMYHL
jgi:hypothetical protein